MVAILSNEKEFIFKAVQDMYTEVASCPDKNFHFPTGRSACLFVGYPVEQLDMIPNTAVESFAGVGYPFMGQLIQPGHTVLDIGSGSGTDVLLASRLVGATGKVYGLDMTDAMLNKLRDNIVKMDVKNVEPIQGNAEHIPLPDAIVDVVTSNGVLNLVPDKPTAFAEIFRVLRPGGAIQISDIVLGRTISESSRQNPRLWAECIVGAAQEAEYLQMFRAAGFVNLEVLHHLDYFSGSASEDTRKVADSFGARTVVFKAEKPIL